MVTRGMIPEYFLASSLVSRKSEAEVVDRYQYISQRAWSPDTFLRPVGTEAVVYLLPHCGAGCEGLRYRGVLRLLHQSWRST